MSSPVKTGYLGMYRVPIGIDEEIHADGTRFDRDESSVRFDTNGTPLRDWDD